MYAIHLSDLSQAKQSAPLVIDLFLRPDYLTSYPVTVEVGRGIDDIAVVLEGSATDDQDRMDATLDLLKGSIGKRSLGRPFRIYRRGPRGGWSKV